MGQLLIPQSESELPLANFLKKDKTPVDAVIARTIFIPPVWYWEKVENKISYKMTMAFQWEKMTFGMSYEINDDNCNHIKIMRNKLFAIVKESLDALVHHGKSILDSSGNIDPRKVREAESNRFWFDPLWAKRVNAFNKLARIAPITEKKAIALGLENEPKKII